jgi:hypothetical protein
MDDHRSRKRHREAARCECGQSAAGDCAYECCTKSCDGADAGLHSPTLRPKGCCSVAESTGRGSCDKMMSTYEDVVWKETHDWDAWLVVSAINGFGPDSLALPPRMTWWRSSVLSKAYRWLDRELTKSGHVFFNVISHGQKGDFYIQAHLGSTEQRVPIATALLARHLQVQCITSLVFDYLDTHASRCDACHELSAHRPPSERYTCQACIAKLFSDEWPLRNCDDCKRKIEASQDCGQCSWCGCFAHAECLMDWPRFCSSVTIKLCDEYLETYY